MSAAVPQRIPHRLKHYDYAESGAYFITFCCYGRQAILGEIRDQSVVLNYLGRIVHKQIDRTNYLRRNAGVEITKYVVMPNHVHLLIELVGSRRAVTAGEAFGSPTKNTIPTIIRALKSSVTREARTVQVGGHGTPWPYGLWQSGYYDHVIRCRQEYLRVWQYIEENPAKWCEDRYYMEGACRHDHS